jgi:hypothetical protein
VSISKPTPNTAASATTLVQTVSFAQAANAPRHALLPHPPHASEDASIHKPTPNTAALATTLARLRRLAQRAFVAVQRALIAAEPPLVCLSKPLPNIAVLATTLVPPTRSVKKADAPPHTLR